MARPERFERLMRASRRDVGASKALLAIVRADSAMVREMERAIAAAGLTLPQFNVLMEIASTPDGALPLHEVCDRLLKSPPNVTALVDRLEREGLVERRRSTEDRRVVAAAITEEGWRSLGRAAPIVFGMERRLLEGFNDRERAVLARLADRVAAAASDAATPS